MRPLPSADGCRGRVRDRGGSDGGPAGFVSGGLVARTGLAPPDISDPVLAVVRSERAGLLARAKSSLGQQEQRRRQQQELHGRRQLLG